MTEDKWLGPAHPRSMLNFMVGRTTSRKLRLFSSGICRALNELELNQFFADALETLEGFADEKVTKLELARQSESLAAQRRELKGSSLRETLPDELRWIWNAFEASLIDDAAKSALSVLKHAIDIIPMIRRLGLSTALTGFILRDIFGNPFRPVTLDPRWLTSTVLDLARSIYDEFPRQVGGSAKMPILADALMDAGCDSEEIISHCRAPGPHVRGCYVVDLILGKE